MSDNWYMIIFLLHDFEIYEDFEDFVLENEVVKNKKYITKLNFEDLAACVKHFLKKVEITESQKRELLKYCKT